MISMMSKTPYLQGPSYRGITLTLHQRPKALRHLQVQPCPAFTATRWAQSGRPQRRQVADASSTQPDEFNRPVQLP